MRTIELGEGRMGIYGPILTDENIQRIAILFRPGPQAEIGVGTIPIATPDEIATAQATDTLLVLGCVKSAETLKHILDFCIQYMRAREVEHD